MYNLREVVRGCDCKLKQIYCIYPEEDCENRKKLMTGYIEEKNLRFQGCRCLSTAV